MQSMIELESARVRNAKIALVVAWLGWAISAFMAGCLGAFWVTWLLLFNR